MAKERLDVLLVERGFAPSRERAKSTIMAGLVLVDDRKIDKAGTMVKPEAVIRILGDNIPYVSRGGLKLAKAMEEFGVQLAGKVSADIGASTGGFTDCMLQNGAVRVFAIDVGYGQLAWSLRTDARVVNMERTNVRNVTATQFDGPVSLVVADLSFISLRTVLPALALVADVAADYVLMVKPQFEVGKSKIGKKGVVRDPQLRAEAVTAVLTAAAELGLGCHGVVASPLPGPNGNVEYFVWLRRGSANVGEDDVVRAIAEGPA